MINSSAIWLAAKYLAANFDWPLYYIADIDDLPQYCINGDQSNFEFEYLSEFETEFNNYWRYESGAQVGKIDGKKSEVENLVLPSL